MTEEYKSEFGMGYAYCLGLFIAHERCLRQDHNYDVSLWFNGAADHLFELQIPENLSEEKKKQIAAFKDRCIRYRLCVNGEKPTFKDINKAIDEAKDLLREWDVFNGIKSIKGEWE